MGWRLMWMPLGAAAFLLVLVNLCLAAAKKRRGWQALLFASLSCGALSMMSVLQEVSFWADHEDWSGIMDVVPTLSAVCTWAVWLGIGLNLLALWLHLRAEKTEKETNGKS